ncbi:MAG: sigma 54-interacting transcriptional regulator [bacterium]|nr:sigma 54-interacting transcriptional regulator [bacterium]
MTTVLPQSWRNKVQNLAELPIAGSLRTYLLSTPAMPEKSLLRKALIVIIFMRVVTLLAILALSGWRALGPGGSQSSAQAVVIPITVILAISIINAFWVRNTRKLRRTGSIQFALDIVFVSFAIYLTGSHSATILYLLVILAASFAFGSHGALLAALFSAICYSLIVGGVMPSPGKVRDHASSMEIFLSYLSLTVIALLSGYLSRQRDLLARMTASQAADLNTLSNERKQIFNDISDGIITVDLDSAITSINEAAKSIMQLKNAPADTLIGRPLPEILVKAGIDALHCSYSELQNEKIKELIIPGKNGTPIHLNYSLRPLTSDDGSQTGEILIFRDMSHLRTMEETLSLHERMSALISQTEEGERITGSLQMIGDSSVMHQVFSLVDKVAPSEASVMICGESGTGKELIANAIHRKSKRCNHPFVAINCGAIPENLIESELFGHKRGAFTGAISDSPGLLRRAEGGTVFLDEIGELPINMQTKLLRVLQEKTVRAIGDTKDYKLDIRIVAATNRNLKQEIAVGTFREDLYYRLNVVNLWVPPLRERTEDIPPLVAHFISKYCDPDQVLPRVSPEALKSLSSYNFPGNVRELENIIERAIVLGGSAITRDHLPDEVKDFTQTAIISRFTNKSKKETTASAISLPVDLDQLIADLERRYITEALDQSKGARKEAADLLGVNMRSLRYRLKKYDM